MKNLVSLRIKNFTEMKALCVFSVFVRAPIFIAVTEVIFDSFGENSGCEWKSSVSKFVFQKVNLSLF